MKGVYLSVAELAVENSVDVDGVGREGGAAPLLILLTQSVQHLHQ